MKTQQTLMAMLHSSSNYYRTPGAGTWDPCAISDDVLFLDTTRNIEFRFNLDPYTNTVKMSGVHRHRCVIVYTPTIAIGTRRFAPDMVLALHTLFSFDFASDAIITVRENMIRRKTYAVDHRAGTTASDAIIAPTPASSPKRTSSLWLRVVRRALFLRGS